MKRSMLGIFIISILIMSSLLISASNKSTVIIINKVTTKLKQHSTVIGKFVLIPFNSVMEADGYKINYDPKLEKTVYKKGYIEIEYKINDSYIRKSGFAISVNNAIQSIDGIMMIKPDLLGELINKDIKYDKAKDTFTINDYVKKAPYTWAKENNLVAHALGVDLAYTASSSFEAMENSYRNGFKLFEVDLNLTSDEHLVARHDWEAYLLKMFKQEVKVDMVGKPLSYYDFMNLKIYKELTPLDIESIIKIMSVHKDIYLITDTKETNEEQVTKAFQAIVEAANKIDPTVLDRIIPQIYNESMLDMVGKVYKFDSIIYTIYQILDSDEKIMDFAIRNNIKVITMPMARASEKFVKGLSDKGIYTYVHTTNSISEIYEYNERGVHGFYTDFITPEYIKSKGITILEPKSIN